MSLGKLNMDTLTAFALGAANKGRELKVFDWDKAAQIIRDRKATTASAGLSGDWEWTGGPILADGKPVPKENTYTYLASNWATPELEVDGHRMDCFRMQSATPGWDSGTYWPESAVNLLQAQRLSEEPSGDTTPAEQTPPA
jgi:hypothetical protein